MEIILLSGGSGKRLWPLSNDSRSKQFLKVLETRDNKYQSMVQRVWAQLKNEGLSKNTTIATSKSQVEIILNQLNDEADIIVEPSRRDTFPAIALAATYLHSVKCIDENEIVAVLPVDPYVNNDFFDKVKELEDAIKFCNSNIALIGVKPTYPSEKYGYIIPTTNNYTETNSKYINVSAFKEKPTKETAEQLLQKGALWNCGIFSFRLSYILNLLIEMNFPVNYNRLLANYSELPKNSFDYQVVEAERNIIVLPYEGEWKDLGTWNTLTEEMKNNQIGKGVLGEGARNTHVINELDIPVTVLGISNAIVAVSPDGILVSDKDKSPKIKDYVQLYNTQPMYDERRWGSYRILDFTKIESGIEVITKKIKVKAGSNLSYQYHNNREETWTIIDGEGLVALNGELKSVTSGDIIKINKKDKHALKAITDLEIIEVQSGISIVEEDIFRIAENWDEIEKKCSKNKILF